ncbi:MAG: VOC family protein [Planctomycetota bacterium]|nr:MAG: VOC family protein [Planctomycetota bacterium]
MTEQTPKPGAVGWMDLTVGDAPAVRDFYHAVVGLTHAGVDMGGYEDYTMSPPGGGDPVCGVCHARGANAGLPPVWIPYFIVENLDASLDACRARGGEALTPVKPMGESRYCIIRDPAGAVCGLYQP